jgi:hypothetical protein
MKAILLHAVYRDFILYSILILIEVLAILSDSIEEFILLTGILLDSILLMEDCSVILIYSILLEVITVIIFILFKPVNGL